MAKRVISWLRSPAKGQSLVELSLLMPIFLLLVVGGVDLARAYYFQVALDGAAREGVRAAANISTTDTAIRSIVIEQAAPKLELTDTNISIVPTGARTAGTPVTVTVSSNFDLITPVLAPLMNNSQTISLTGTAVGVVY